VWAIILRISKPRASVRLKIISSFVALVGVAFVGVIMVVMRLTTEYMMDQRIKEEMGVADVVALEAASSLSASDASDLWNVLLLRGREHQARFLVVGNTGVVLADSQTGLVGADIGGYAEVREILDASRDQSYGLHSETQGQDVQWVGYFTSVITHESQRIGVLLMSASVQDLMDRLSQVRFSMYLYFGVIMLAVIYAGAAIAGVITKPINALTQVITKTSGGDFSVRVKARGSDELARLGRTFNMMSERLEHQDQMRNDFISNASHELKTPLSAMKILIESIIHQKEFNPEITREFLGDVNGEIDRLSDIVSDLLVLVRFDSDAMRMETLPVELQALLEDTCDRLLPVAREAGIRLTIAPHAPMSVMGDAGKLQQVFYNLIDNAIKYTPHGGDVRVELQRSGADALIAVRDNGIGIAPEDAAHIFDRFYRVDKARSRATGGTGLGLSIARNIVVSHGGDIQIDSREGEGSVFTVTLPLAAD
jgi:signal transduction histidine kinase